MSTLLRLEDIPQDVINASCKLAMYFAQENIKHWTLGDCTARANLDVYQESKLSEIVEDQKKIIGNLEAQIIGLEAAVININRDNVRLILDVIEVIDYAIASAIAVQNNVGPYPTVIDAAKHKEIQFRRVREQFLAKG